MKEIMKKLMGSATLTRATYILVSLLIIIFTFWAGMEVGGRRGEFSRRWDDNYPSTFMGSHSPFSMMRGKNERDEVRISHGAFGQVVSINSTDLVIKSNNEPEKSIQISTSTEIRNFHDTAKISDIKVGDTIVVIGTPDSKGTIDASLIRIVPTMMQNYKNTSATSTMMR